MISAKDMETKRKIEPTETQKQNIDALINNLATTDYTAICLRSSTICQGYPDLSGLTQQDMMAIANYISEHGYSCRIIYGNSDIYVVQIDLPNPLRLQDKVCTINISPDAEDSDNKDTLCDGYEKSKGKIFNHWWNRFM